MNDKKAFDLILCIINTGFSDLVMNAAKSEGARGGTIVHARGTGNKEIEKIFGISIQPEKELVMIVVAKDIKDEVLKAIYREAGLETPGHGIAFSVELDDVVGLSLNNVVDIPQK